MPTQKIIKKLIAKNSICFTWNLSAPCGARSLFADVINAVIFFAFLYNYFAGLIDGHWNAPWFPCVGVVVKFHYYTLFFALTFAFHFLLLFYLTRY